MRPDRLEIELFGTEAGSRRRAAQDRHLRAGPWRHAVPRRGRRHAARDPGQDRARAAGADLRAGRRLEPGRGRCPRHRLDQSRARRRDRRRPVPRGSLLSAQRRADPRAAAARAARGHPAAGPAFHGARAPRRRGLPPREIRRGRDGGAAGLCLAGQCAPAAQRRRLAADHGARRCARAGPRRDAAGRDHRDRARRSSNGTRAARS